MRESIHPRILLGLGSLVSLALASSCATLQQVAALRQVAFSIDRVDEVRIAEVAVRGKDSYQDLSVTDVARLAAAVAARNVPLECIVHVRAENPSSNQVSARLVELDWTFFIEDNEIVTGRLDKPYVLPPGSPVDIPLAVRFDAWDLYRSGGRDLFELALALAGVGGFHKEVRLTATPTVETSIGPIRYPGSITIVRSEVGTP